MEYKEINVELTEAGMLHIKLKQAFALLEDAMELVPDQLTEQWRWNDDCFYSEVLDCYELWEGLENEPSEDGMSLEVYMEQAEAAIKLIHEITKQIEDKLEEFGTKETDLLKLLKGVGWVPPYLQAEYEDVVSRLPDGCMYHTEAISLYQRIDAAQAQDYHVRATRMISALDRLARDLEEMRDKHPAAPMDWRHMATRVERFRNQLNSTINDGRERRGTCRSCGAKDVPLWREYENEKHD